MNNRTKILIFGLLASVVGLALVVFRLQHHTLYQQFWMAYPYSFIGGVIILSVLVAVFAFGKRRPAVRVLFIVVLVFASVGVGSFTATAPGDVIKSQEAYPEPGQNGFSYNTEGSHNVVVDGGSTAMSWSNESYHFRNTSTFTPETRNVTQPFSFGGTVLPVNSLRGRAILGDYFSLYGNVKYVRHNGQVYAYMPTFSPLPGHEWTGVVVHTPTNDTKELSPREARLYEPLKGQPLYPKAVAVHRHERRLSSVEGFSVVVANDRPYYYTWSDGEVLATNTRTGAHHTISHSVDVSNATDRAKRHFNQTVRDRNTFGSPFPVYDEGVMWFAVNMRDHTTGELEKVVLLSQNRTEVVESDTQMNTFIWDYNESSS